jgi:hypothetical protein
LHYLPGTDPMVAACEFDTRPEAYVREFVAGARRLILSDTVTDGGEVPPWWHLAAEAPESQSTSRDFSTALGALRQACNEENAA